MSLIDRSGTIVAGGTSQQVCPVNTNRKYLFIQNLSTHDLWVNLDGIASATLAGSILLAGGTTTADGNVAGGSLELTDCDLKGATGVVSVTGGTAGEAFCVKEGE